MKNNINMTVIGTFLVAIALVSSYGFLLPSDPPNSLLGNWSLSLIYEDSPKTTVVYDLNLEDNGQMVLFCDEAINVAGWSWENGTLAFHLQSEDQQLNSLNEVWKLNPVNGSAFILTNPTLNYSLNLVRRAPDLDL